MNKIQRQRDWYSNEKKHKKKESEKEREQAGAELGQAQLKLGLDFNKIDYT